MTDRSKPKMSNSFAEKELDKAEKQLEAFENQVKELTLDRMNEAPTKEVEQQTKIAQVDKDKMRDIYLKPDKTIASREKFNENYRKEYNEAKEYVHFTAENKEIIGETIEMWTKPFAGLPAEFWKIPTNRPIWAPRYVAEQIKGRKYHRLVMQEHVTSGNPNTQFYGQMVVDTTIQRLDAHPESTKRSIFMGANSF